MQSQSVAVHIAIDHRIFTDRHQSLLVSLNAIHRPGIEQANSWSINERCQVVGL